MTPQNLTHPDRPAPFEAYRRPDARELGPQLCKTLSHFFESEKFRFNEPLRQAVLDASTPREARKISRRHNAAWRGDWKDVRGAVFRAGLRMQLRRGADWRAIAQGWPAVVADQKWLASRPGGLPAKFIAREVQQLVADLQDLGAPRVAAFTLGPHAPDNAAGRLDSLFAVRKPLTCLLYSGGDAAPGVEEWCEAWAVPLSYAARSAHRLRAQEHSLAIRRTNVLIVSGPETKELEALIADFSKGRRASVARWPVEVPAA